MITALAGSRGIPVDSNALRRSRLLAAILGRQITDRKIKLPVGRLLHDYRLSLFRRPCPDPPKCCCVRLARIHFDAKTCRITCIHDCPPYRRDRRCDPWVPSGEVNLYQCLGAPQNKVEYHLKSMGCKDVKISKVFTVPKTISRIRTVFEFKADKPTDLFCACPDEPVDVVTLSLKNAEYPEGCVIAFRKRVKP